MSRSLPADVLRQSIDRIECAAFEQTLGQTQRHRGVVRPLAGLEVERAAADHVGDWREGAWLGELQGGTERIAGRQAKQGAAVAIERRDMHLHQPTCLVFHFLHSAHTATSCRLRRDRVGHTIAAIVA